MQFGRSSEEGDGTRSPLRLARDLLKVLTRLRKHWDLETAIVAAGLGFSVFGLVTPYLSRLVVDYAFLARDWVVFWMLPVKCSLKSIMKTLDKP